LFHVFKLNIIINFITQVEWHHPCYPEKTLAVAKVYVLHFWSRTRTRLVSGRLARFHKKSMIKISSTEPLQPFLLHYLNLINFLQVIEERSIEIRDHGGFAKMFHEQPKGKLKKRLAFLDLLLNMVEKGQLTLQDVCEETDTLMFEVSNNVIISLIRNWIFYTIYDCYEILYLIISINF